MQRYFSIIIHRILPRLGNYAAVYYDISRAVCAGAVKAARKGNDELPLLCHKPAPLCKLPVYHDYRG